MMESLFFRCCSVALSVFAVAVLAIPANARISGHRTTRLPLTVRQMMPRGALSLRIYRVAPAPKAPRYLLHLWTAPRRHPENIFVEERKPQTYSGQISRAEIESKVSLSMASLADSPFVFDILTDEKVPKYLSSIVFTAKVAPKDVSLRYLNSKTKQGFILQVDEGADYDFKHTFYAFDHGFHADSYGFTPNYRSSVLVGRMGYGGGNEYLIYRATDGLLAVLERRYGKGGTIPDAYWKWNGERFVEKKKPRSE